MTEDNEVRLEVDRFIVSPESANSIQKLTDMFPEIQKQYPYLSGFGVFGSRTKGQERPSSDYDVCVFYNSDRITSLKDGNRVEWQKIRISIEEALSGHLDHRIEDPSAGLRINISRERTNEELEMFVDAARPFVDQDVDEGTLLNGVGIPPTQNLYSRFFMVFGEEVVANRKYILEQLKARSYGDKYIQILMTSLAWFEKGKELSFAKK